MSSGLQELLGVADAPVAVSFVGEIPEGVGRVESTALSGCSYWKQAAQGDVFATVPEDHFSCPIGAFTHGVELPEAEAEGQQQMIGMMVELQYVRMEEVPDIPHRTESFGAVVYSPLEKAPCAVDAVIVQGTPRQMMILAEAATAAGVDGGPTMGRPTCAAIPEVMQESRFVTNLGCIGNRVYTELADEELYVILPGSQVDAIQEKLAAIVSANGVLEEFHGGRVTEVG